MKTKKYLNIFAGIALMIALGSTSAFADGHKVSKIKIKFNKELLIKTINNIMADPAESLAEAKVWMADIAYFQPEQVADSDPVLLLEPWMSSSEYFDTEFSEVESTKNLETWMMSPDYFQADSDIAEVGSWMCNPDYFGN